MTKALRAVKVAGGAHGALLPARGSVLPSPGRAMDRRIPPRVITYVLEGRYTVLVGRTDVDNDRLSLGAAAPDDYWFHVRGMPGSHVLLRHPEGDEPSRGILKAAASIAAWHSKARNGGNVAVSCTKARYVVKPRGAGAGTVQIRKEIVLKVRPGLGDATPQA